MTYLAHMDEREAVRLAYAAMLYALDHPDAVVTSPILALAEVLARPPWSLDKDDAILFVAESLRTRP